MALIADAVGAQLAAQCARRQACRTPQPRWPTFPQGRGLWSALPLRPWGQQGWMGSAGVGGHAEMRGRGGRDDVLCNGLFSLYGRTWFVLLCSVLSLPCLSDAGTLAVSAPGRALRGNKRASVKLQCAHQDLAQASRKAAGCRTLCISPSGRSRATHGTPQKHMFSGETARWVWFFLIGRKLDCGTAWLFTCRSSSSSLFFIETSASPLLALMG